MVGGKRSIWIGYEPREKDAYEVCKRSITAHSRAVRDGDITINPIILQNVKSQGLYWRTHTYKNNVFWDEISDAPCSTQFSITRFLTPIMAETGWALFMDCDMLCRADISELFALADPHYAVMVVKHKHEPDHSIKMDGQVQTQYSRKNWSSVCLYNADHPANNGLTVDIVNTWTGRDLHAFKWLGDDLIGELPARWNHLVGVDTPDDTACIAHFTLGIPSMRGWDQQEFANQWRGWL